MARKPLANQKGFFDEEEESGVDEIYADQSIEQFVEFGDIWIVDKIHRVMCGDTGYYPSIAKLMQGKMADLIHCDPPYNVGVQSESEKKHKAKAREIANDNMPEAEFEKKLLSWFENMSLVLAPGRSYYFWGGFANVEKFPYYIRQSGLHFSQPIIWVKNTPRMSRGDFMLAHEWCFFGWKQRPGYPHYRDKNSLGLTDVWRVPNVPRTKMIHLTEKPVEIPKIAIQASSREGEIVLDPFGGSGSTLIAAATSGRIGYTMEVDPWYASLILNRCDRLGMKIEKEIL